MFHPMLVSLATRAPRRVSVRKPMGQVLVYFSVMSHGTIPCVCSVTYTDKLCKLSVILLLLIR